MSNQIESALVIALHDSIRWESALNETPDSAKIAETGTLYPITSTDVFNPTSYQLRDRQLAYRDLINAAAIVDVSVQVSDVWNYPALKPRMEGPAEQQMTAVAPTEITSVGSSTMLRHVDTVSVPYDAARYSDRDLYGRDCAIYELLARACQATFSDPPIQRIDASGSNIPGSTAWSLGEGVSQRADINPALPLSINLFKKPDQNLAERDNQMAAYAARLMQVLKNPFVYATRLYIEVSQVERREPEVYVLAVETATQRTWIAEPALSNRNRIVYDILSKTLSWTRENVNEVHVPQLYAMSIPGIEVGQLLNTLADIPETKDAQYWRSKAETIVPIGGSFSDLITLTNTAIATVTGGHTQINAASFLTPDQLTLTIPGAVLTGRHRIALLVNPNPVVEISGASNTSAHTGTLGGVDFAINVASGAIADNTTYLVENGDGIVYNSQNYLPGSYFAGVTGVSTYTQIGSPSSVRQYKTEFSLALPPGAWTLEVSYTNLLYTSDGFGIVAQISYGGASPIDVIKDIVIEPFTGSNGDLMTSSVGHFDVANTNPFSLPVYWTYGTGQFHLRQLTFRNTSVHDCRIAMSGTIDTGASNVDVVAVAGRPETLLFHVETIGSISPVDLVLNLNGTPGVDPLLPVQILEVQIQEMGTYNATPASSDFQSWRQECLDRAERALQQSFTRVVKAYGTDFPVFYTSGSTWDYVNSDEWMSIIEVEQLRLREIPDIEQDNLAVGRQYEVTVEPVTYGASTYLNGDRFYATESAGTIYSAGSVKQVGAFALAHAGHVGKPCLVPLGLNSPDNAIQLESYGTTALPVLAACQPWMIAAGLYTAQPEFWTPQYL